MKGVKLGECLVAFQRVDGDQDVRGLIGQLVVNGHSVSQRLEQLRVAVGGSAISAHEGAGW